MAALVCDICGGKLIVGAGGVTVCDSCGMEYSVERMREKIQEIKGVVQIDNSNMIENWMKMGDRATQAQNYQEACEYYTKIVETDPENIIAIYKRGKSNIKQSTIEDIKAQEFNVAYKIECETVAQQNDIEKLEKLTSDYVKTIIELCESLKNEKNQVNVKLANERADNYQFLKDCIANFTVLAQQMSEGVNLIPEKLSDQISNDRLALEKYLVEFLMYFGSGFPYYGGKQGVLTKAFPMDEWKTIRHIFIQTLFAVREKEPDAFMEYYQYPSATSYESKPCDVCKFWKTEIYKLLHKDEYDHILEEKQRVYNDRKSMGSKISYCDSERDAVNKKEAEITNLESELKKIGFLKIKERKAMSEKIDRAKKERSQLEDELNRRYSEFDHREKEYKEQENQLQKQLETIGSECDGSSCKHFR